MKKAPPKNEAAAALAALRWASATKEERAKVGRNIAPLGGKRRAEKLSAKRRQEIARKAATARWGKRKGTESD